MNCQDHCECIPLKLIKQLQKKRTIQELDLQQCNIEHLNNLQQVKGEIQCLYAASNKISSLFGLPATLQYLDISNNKIKDVTVLSGSQLRTLRIANNLIQQFEIQLAKVDVIDLSSNYLEKLPTKITAYSLNISGNLFKNYETEAIEKYDNLIILDGQLISGKQSSEHDHIIKMQEQQLATKFNMSVDHLSKWRQEVFKLLVHQKSYKILFKSHIKQIENQFNLLMKYSHSVKIESLQKQIVQLQKHIQTCANQLKKRKQQQHYQQQVIVHSLKNVLESQEDNPEKLIKQTIQYVQDVRLKSQELKLQKDLLTNENELLKAQAEHFQHLYSSLKQQSSQLEPQVDKQKGFQQLFLQIRQLEEEKLRLQLELQSAKEMKSLEILQNKAQLEQQVALLTQELEFNKQKLTINQEETRIRMEQQSQSYEKRIKLLEQEHQHQADQIRHDCQSVIEGYVHKEQQKNSDLLKMKDYSNDLELNIRTLKQEYEFKLKELQQQNHELQLTVRQNKSKIHDLEVFQDQLREEYSKQIDELKQTNDMSLQEQNKIFTELQEVIHSQGQELEDLKIQKKTSQQQMQKLIEIKEGVIRQLTLQDKKPVNNQFQKTIQMSEELEQRALQYLNDDD